MTRAVWLKSLFIVAVLLLTPLSWADAAKHTKILVVGDSLSAAYRLPVEAGWVAMIERHLASQNKDVSIKNVSISGATTAGGLKLMPTALSEHKPDIVVLGLGANDGLQGKPLPYIKKNLSRLIAMSHSAGARVLLLGIRIPPNYGSAYTEPFYEQYQSLSNEFGTALVPFMLEDIAVMSELMMEDGKHPNAEGQKSVFKLVWPKLEALIDEINGV